MSHLQTKQPFEIPERSVKDPQGKVFGGRRARVYWLLSLAAQKGTRFEIGHGRRSDAGWVPLWAVREPWSGGGQGDRRLRELRTLHGYQVHKRAIDGAETTVYRIGAPARLCEPKASRREEVSIEGPKRRMRPLRGVVARIVEETGQAVDEMVLEPGHPVWPALGGHHVEGWLEQMRGLWKRKELIGWVGRRELVLVLRPEDADRLLFDLRQELVDLLRTLGAEIRP